MSRRGGRSDQQERPEQKQGVEGGFLAAVLLGGHLNKVAVAGAMVEVMAGRRSASQVLGSQTWKPLPSFSKPSAIDIYLYVRTVVPEPVDTELVSNHLIR